MEAFFYPEAVVVSFEVVSFAMPYCHPRKTEKKNLLHHQKITFKFSFGEYVIKDTDQLRTKVTDQLPDLSESTFQV